MLVVDLLERLLQLDRIDFFSALLGETALGNPDILNDSDAARWHSQRSVLHVSSLFTENRAEEAFFRSEFGFRLRGDLADEDIAGFHFRTDADDAVVVEIAERILTDVRNITGDFFRSQLGVAGGDIEFRDVDRSVNVVLDHALGDDDGIFEVVTIPRHERDEDVPTDGELTVLGVRSVGEHLALLDFLTQLDDRLLVDAGAGIRAHELAQRIGHDALGHVGFHGLGVAEELFLGNRELAIRSGDDDFRSRGGDDAVRFGNHHGTGVAGSLAFQTGADQRRLGNEQRHALALHVRAHQRAVRVIVLEEWNQTGSNGNELLGRNVHVIHIRGQGFDELATFFTGGDSFGLENPLLVDRVVSLGDEEILLLVGREILDLIGDLRIHHPAVWGFNETELVDPGIGAHRVDETDVRTFRSFDRADPAIVGRMHVADFEAGAVAVETTWSKSRQTALVGELGERIGLVHELRKLRTAEEIAHDSG